MFAILLLSIGLSSGQIADDDSTSIRKLKIGGYIDSYFGSSLYSAKKIDRPYFVSSSGNNEANINLAFLETRWRGDRFRFNVVPAMGSYMRRNYAAEKEIHKYIFEANAGLKLSDKLNIWLDGGIFDSPYSSEGAVSRDQLLYSRSFAPEHVPYYLTGLRLTIKPNDKWSLMIMRLNGWQQITDLNFKKSIGTSLTVKTGEFSNIIWNTYLGDERSESNPDFRMRIFNDLYIKISDQKLWDAAIGGYIGTQQRENKNASPWWQFNVMGKRQINNFISLSGRVEYFSDPRQVMIHIPDTEFKVFSTGTCLNLNVGKTTLLRIDSRFFSATEKIYSQRNGKSDKELVLTASLTSWF